MTNVDKAIALLNEARSLLESTKEIDLRDAAEDIGPILLAIEAHLRSRGEAQ